MEQILKIGVCISSKRIRQKEQTSTGFISSATNLHIFKLLECKTVISFKLGLSLADSFFSKTETLNETSIKCERQSRS